ncbi:high mobility group B protein 3-like isoform X2 [Nymphaea colorata]|uniref:high mobility group B protein 3-like isoform X2 n=1 Tax=Nymphaea colorata TaxID=210225 RepID=UPI00214EDCF9|nr:high mobility group B protein 3-like isoform X2 [Nymphaea colorata]
MSTQPPACPVTSLTSIRGLSPPFVRKHPSLSLLHFSFLTGERESERARESLLLLSSVSKRMKGGKGKGATKKEASLKLVDDRKLGKRKAAVKPSKNSKRAEKKKKIAKKDPNKPKRPPSAFFVFLEEFRKTYKQEHPNVKSVSVVGKAGGEKWKSMSDAEKAPFEAKAAKKKSEYEKLISAYNKKQESVADDGDEESDRSKSEMNDDEDEEDVEL